VEKIVEDPAMRKIRYRSGLSHYCGSRPVRSGLPGWVRISLGSAIAQAAYAVAVRAATELLTSGTYDPVTDGIAYKTIKDAVATAPGVPG